MFRVLGSLLFILVVVGLYIAVNGSSGLSSGSNEQQPQDGATAVQPAQPASPATPVPGNKNFNL